jgi:hypothetical protein
MNQPDVTESPIEELEALAPEARAVDSEHLTAPAAEGVQTAPGQIEAAQAQDEKIKHLSGLLQALAKIIAPMLPTVGAIYSKETCDEVAGGIVPLAIKRGWSIPSVGKWEEEITCAMIVIPLGFVTYGAAKADIEALKKSAEETPGAQPDKLPAQVESIGKAEPIFSAQG